MSSIYAISDGEASDAISSGGQYEVFLSFRGQDTRTGFTDHLYTRLIDAGIRTYRDDEELKVGEEISSELIAGINQSKIAIPIFSKGYAASKWCLKELAHIAECKRTKGLKVMPIFYDVTPSHVRHQTGDFAEAFVSHEKLYDDETISGWKEALKVVGALKGWDIQSNRNRQEGKFVKEVTTKILHELKKAYLIVTDCLVGTDHLVEKILNKVCAKTGGVQILGIYGMGGVGKTTLGKVIYNLMLSQFENSIFLADVRETSRSKGLEFLQNQLISSLLKIGFPSITNIDEGIAVISTRFSNKKALIVLDDVDENFQLQGLVGKREWFGPGTRIIITTRNRSVLDFIQVDWPFEHNSMDLPQALQLFSKHAFRNDKPPETHIKLSEKIVKITGGLPLVLEVVGSLLCGKSMKYWHFILKKLEKVPPKEVMEKLRVSFETLDEHQKQIFLDIACFFIGIDYRIAIHYWDDSKLFPDEAIEVLQQMSLIKIKEDNLLWMHDQLRDYGRDIICQENMMDPEKRSRLWSQEEATKVFMTNAGTDKIQGICVEANETSFPYFVLETYAKLSKVRLFWAEMKPFHNHPIWPLFWAKMEPFLSYPNQLSNTSPSNFLPENPHVFSKIRWLSLHWFPCEYIKASNFSLLELTILDLSYSDFTVDWGGWRQIKRAKNLKVLNLTRCHFLVITPDFSSHLLLERLILERCSGLVEIDESIGMLKHLVHLNLNGCRRLRKLPKELYCMESLTELLISETNIVEIPQWGSMVKLEVFFASGCTLLKNCILLNNFTSLNKLSLEGTQISLIPNSIGELVHLVELHLVGCYSLKKLPESIGGLVSLTHLDISNSGIEELPNSIGCLKNLIVLRMCNTPIRELPSTIRMAGRLEEIDAKSCRLLRGGLPMLPESLIFSDIPFEIMDAVIVPDLSNLINLVHFGIDVNEWVPRKWARIENPSPQWIGRLNKVKKLDLAFPWITTLHPDLGALSLLTELRLVACVHLQSIPKLPSNLTSLAFIRCESWEKTICGFSYLKKLSTLKIIKTPLMKLEGLYSLDSLTYLRLDGCMISKVDELPENLERLFISNCENLKKLPQMSQYKKLQILRLSECHSLVEIPGRLESLIALWIVNCKSLIRILDILNVKTLYYLQIKSCPGLGITSLYHFDPILKDNSPKSEHERSFMNTMLRMCGYSQDITFGNEEVKGKGKDKMEVD